jgi:hypothetical protein
MSAGGTHCRVPLAGRSRASFPLYEGVAPPAFAGGGGDASPVNCAPRCAIPSLFLARPRPLTVLPPYRLLPFPPHCPVVRDIPYNLRPASVNFGMKAPCP